MSLEPSIQSIKIDVLMTCMQYHYRSSCCKGHKSPQIRAVPVQASSLPGVPLLQPPAGGPAAQGSPPSPHLLDKGPPAACQYPPLPQRCGTGPPAAGRPPQARLPQRLGPVAAAAAAAAHAAAAAAGPVRGEAACFLVSAASAAWPMTRIDQH
jgi:hypothetical protein